MGRSQRSMFSSIPIPHNHAVISLASLASPSVRTFRHTDIREHEPRLERNASADLRSRNLNSGTSPTLGFQFPVQGARALFAARRSHNNLSLGRVGGFVG